MNLVVLIGRVCGPPELRYTPGGKGVAQFTLAVDRTRGKDKDADFITITAWERLAEICNEYLTKGKQVMIQGRLQIRTYEAQDGTKRKAAEVVCTHMEMLGGGKSDRAKDDGGGRSGSSRGGAPEGWGSGGGYDADDLSVDEIPF